MNSNISKAYTNKKYALIAGTSLLIMAITAIFAFAVVFNRLVISTDAAKTYANISTAYSLFNTGIAAWLLILLLDLLVAYSLYIYLKPVNNHLSLLSSGLRVAYSLFLATGICYQFLASKLVASGLNDSLLNTTTLQNEVLQRVMSFEALWSLGLICFGLHLIVLSMLVLKTGIVPKWICLLLLVAGIAYMLIHGINTFMPNQQALTSLLETVLGLPMAIAELSFALWLLVSGGKPFLNAAK